MNTGALLCADIGASFIKLGLSPAAGRVGQVARLAMPVDSWPAFIGALAQLIAELAVADEVPLAISTAGLVSPQSGEVMAANIPCFAGRPLAAAISQHLGRRVVVANDADCFALAEAHVGSCRDLDVVIGAILGSGVGGGLVINGRLVRGHGGVTGEWGHGAIVADSVILQGERRQLTPLACGCGQQGCVDTIGGARGLERLHQQLHQQTLDSRQILSLWHQQQPQALMTIAAWLQLLGRPLALMVNIVGASRVAVGGGLASEPALIAALDQQVRRGVLYPYSDALIVPGQFARDGGLIGASVLGRQCP